MDFPLLIRVLVPIHLLMVVLLDVSAGKDKTCEGTTTSTGVNMEYVYYRLGGVVTVVLYVLLPELMKIDSREAYGRWTGVELSAFSLVVGISQWIVALAYHVSHPDDVRRPVRLYILAGFSSSSFVMLLVFLVGRCRSRRSSPLLHVEVEEQPLVVTPNSESVV